MTRYLQRPVTQEQRDKRKESFARAQLQQRGLDLPAKPPRDEPELPSDLTELDDGALMTLFGRMTTWTNYLAGQLAEAEVSEEFAEAALAKHKAIGAVRNSGEKTVTAAKARAYEDPSFLDAEAARLNAYAYRKLLAARFGSSDKKNTLISRELTRRVGRSDRDERNSRWNP